MLFVLGIILLVGTVGYMLFSVVNLQSEKKLPKLEYEGMTILRDICKEHNIRPWRVHSFLWRTSTDPEWRFAGFWREHGDGWSFFVNDNVKEDLILSLKILEVIHPHPDRKGFPLWGDDWVFIPTDPLNKHALHELRNGALNLA